MPAILTLQMLGQQLHTHVCPQTEATRCRDPTRAPANIKQCTCKYRVPASMDDADGDDDDDDNVGTHDKMAQRSARRNRGLNTTLTTSCRRVNTYFADDRLKVSIARSTCDCTFV